MLVMPARLCSETVWGEVLGDRHTLHLCLREMEGAEADLLRDRERV